MKNARPSAFGTTLLAAGVILLMLASLLLVLPILTCPECHGAKFIGPTITEIGKEYPFLPCPTCDQKGSISFLKKWTSKQNVPAR